MIFMIFDCRETDQWCFMKADVLMIFTVFDCRETDILSFMKSDVLMILGCRETLRSYEIWSVDDF